MDRLALNGLTLNGCTSRRHHVGPWCIGIAYTAWVATHRLGHHRVVVTVILHSALPSVLLGHHINEDAAWNEEEDADDKTHCASNGLRFLCHAKIQRAIGQFQGLDVRVSRAPQCCPDFRAAVHVTVVEICRRVRAANLARGHEPRGIQPIAHSRNISRVPAGARRRPATPPMSLTATNNHIFGWHG